MQPGFTAKGIAPSLQPPHSGMKQMKRSMKVVAKKTWYFYGTFLVVFPFGDGLTLITDNTYNPGV